MGKAVKFDPRRRRRRNGAGPSSYFRRAPRPPKPPRFDPGGHKRRARRRVGLAWLALLAAIFAWAAWDSRDLLNTPDTSATAPQTVDGSWTRCQIGRGRYCVSDGDSFKIGQTKFRVQGIDTPEREARCEREQLKAEAATEALLTWLNAGPFTMEGDPLLRTDRYGRELRRLYRIENGQRRGLAEAMVDAGLARPYDGGARRDWCS